MKSSIEPLNSGDVTSSISMSNPRIVGSSFPVIVFVKLCRGITPFGL